MATECPIVQCQGGKLRGFVGKANHPDSKNVYKYFGIPFADPPLGKLRFLPPKPYSGKWEGVRDATKFSKCPMHNTMQEEMLQLYDLFPNTKVYERSEDCLYLDVYTPTRNKKANLPVMVWFYGGGFAMGENAYYDCTALSGLNDVVLVVPNYRLHLFGFLSFGPDSCLPGNAGLWDQNMSLKWVKDNISNFGGDPGNVTIFGESAGSMSVACHLVSPSSRGLFHKAILHSGTTFSENMDPKRSITSAEDLIQKLEIKTTDPEKRLKLLQAMDCDKLQKAYIELTMEEKGSFGLVTDNVLIPKDPKEILKNHEMIQVPCIIGYNNSEGTGLMGSFIPDFNTGLKEEMLTMVLQGLFSHVRPNDNIENLVEHAKKFYIKDHNDPLRFTMLYGDIFTDTIFRLGSIVTAKAFAEMGVDTYMYLAAFQVQCHHDKSEGKTPLKADFVECDHGDDLFLTFGIPFFHGPVKCTDNERALSRNFMKYLTNFAKHGDPNKGSSVPAKWPKYDVENFKTLQVGPSNFTDFKNDLEDAIAFWAKTY